MDVFKFLGSTVYVQLDSRMQTDAMRMGLSTLYLQGSQARISKL